MDLVTAQHIGKTYPGVERSLRGTKLEMKGPALWLHNMRTVGRLTSNSAPPVPALVDVSLRVTAGEILGLVGRNGSGKTTLIKILAGLLRPSQGTGQVAGIALDQPHALRRLVSYVSTTGWMGLEWPLTAEENVRFFAALCGLPAHVARRRAEEALRAVDLWDNRHKYPSQLSNGMRQRVILARALLLRTPLLLLDEPTVGLDPLSARLIIDLIRGPLRERGQTIILTDHQATEMELLADRIALLHAGRIIMSGTPRALLAQVADVTIIELHTEEMEAPTTPPPESVLAAQSEDRPGALGQRVWRMQVRKGAEALPEVLAWVTQPAGRIVFLAETAPRLSDILDRPVSPTALSPTAPWAEEAAQR